MVKRPQDVYWQAKKRFLSRGNPKAQQGTPIPRPVLSIDGPLTPSDLHDLEDYKVVVSDSFSGTAALDVSGVTGGGGFISSSGRKALVCCPTSIPEASRPFGVYADSSTGAVLVRDIIFQDIGTSPIAGGLWRSLSGGGGEYRDCEWRRCGTPYVTAYRSHRSAVELAGVNNVLTRPVFVSTQAGAVEMGWVPHTWGDWDYTSWYGAAITSLKAFGCYTSYVAGTTDHGVLYAYLDWLSKLTVTSPEFYDCQGYAALYFDGTVRKYTVTGAIVKRCVRAVVDQGGYGNTLEVVDTDCTSSSIIRDQLNYQTGTGGTMSGASAPFNGQLHGAWGAHPVAKVPQAWTHGGVSCASAANVAAAQKVLEMDEDYGEGSSAALKAAADADGYAAFRAVADLSIATNLYLDYQYGGRTPVPKGHTGTTTLPPGLTGPGAGPQE